MKLVLTLICIVSAATAIENKLDAIRNSCIQSTNIDPQKSTNIRSGIFDDSDPKEKEYVLCMSRKMKLVSDPNTLNADFIIQSIASTEEEAKALFKKCESLKENILETAYATYKCLVQTDPKKIPGTL